MIGMKTRGLQGALAALLVVASLSAAAQGSSTYYRWKDDRGNPVHSDRPPPEGVDYEVVSTGSSMVRKVDASEGAVPKDLESAPGNEFTKVDNKAAEKAKANPELCERARKNLEVLNTQARIRLRDENGDIRYITEEEKEAQKLTAQEQITRHCP